MKNKTISINKGNEIYQIKDIITVSGDTSYLVQNTLTGDIRTISPLEITHISPERDTIGIALDVIYIIDEYIPVLKQMLKNSRQQGGNDE